MVPLKTLFEERGERQRSAWVSKADLINYALEHVPSPFGISDVQRLCPNVSRYMVRVAMNRWRWEGKLKVMGRGRDAKWERVKEKRGKTTLTW